MNPVVLSIIKTVLTEALEHGMEIANMLTSPEDIKDSELYKRIPARRKAVLARAQRKIRQAEKGLSPI